MSFNMSSLQSLGRGSCALLTCNQNVMAASTAGHANSHPGSLSLDDAQEISSLLKKRLQMDNPHKQWLAVILVGKVRQVASSARPNSQRVELNRSTPSPSVLESRDSA